MLGKLISPQQVTETLDFFAASPPQPIPEFFRIKKVFSSKFIKHSGCMHFFCMTLDAPPEIDGERIYLDEMRD